MSQLKTGVHCALCGRALSNPLSVVRGIGPVCIKYIKTDEGKVEIKRISRELGLPCYLHSECRFCPYNIYRTCPRERLVLKKNLKNNSPKICAFCGKPITNGSFTYKSGTKIILECGDCHQKNKSWRKL